jgi:putative two-component system response regulator
LTVSSSSDRPQLQWLGPAASEGQGATRTEARERDAARVLVVDDEDGVRRAVARVLRTLGHEVQVANDGVAALHMLGPHIDLIVLDADMPGLDGFELTRRIRETPDYFDLPIVMLTGLEGREHRIRALQAGVNDFLSKPFDPTELEARTRWLLQLKQAHDTIKQQREDLENTVRKRTAALSAALEEVAAAHQQTHEAHLDTIRRLVLAAEHKDRATAAHIERIGLFCELLADHLRLPPERTALIRHGSQMHDVGKLGIPDRILQKPGTLDPPEWEVMKQHATMGARILQGSASEIMHVGEVVALSHHEWWDGSGYPSGLAGEEIPLEGRICAVADVFDALTTKRPYRRALPNNAVFDMMRTERGRHFDPQILDAFTSCRKEVENIQQQYRYVTGETEIPH